MTKNPVEVQHQIRANAAELQDYFSDLYAWEKTIEKEDFARKRRAKTVKRSTAIAPRVVGDKQATSQKEPDAHTYDKGYKRWEKFDVDAALQEVDNDKNLTQKNDGSLLKNAPTHQPVSMNKPIKSREELDREEGNAHYKRGDYVAAIKSYTRCLGYNLSNAVVLSNRAMAYLKNREFANAEDDCTLALKADPSHVKSYTRRGTARNVLGKHRLALLDFYCAMTLEPRNRQIQLQLQSTRELIRTAIKRSPKRTDFVINVIEVEECPDQDNNDSEIKRLLNNQEPLESPASSPISSENKQKVKVISLPKLPSKAPVTSYEFYRVWKTLALRGDAEQKSKLLNLRADYLGMIDPSTFCHIFKTAMESDTLCEIFYVLRHIVAEPTVSTKKSSHCLAIVHELTKMPRFNMTIMLLSTQEKELISAVLQRLETLEGGAHACQVANLKKLYELP